MARLRADRVGAAYVLCCFVSTAVVAAAFLPIVAWNITSQGEWTSFNFLYFVERGASIWLMLSVLGLFVAGPFVFVATWSGVRYHLESAPYYAVLGGLVMSALVYLLFGLPRETPFGSAIVAWLFGPSCGIVWGLAWWYLHRRWISATERQSDVR